MSHNRSTFESDSQNLLEVIVTIVRYSNKDIKEKPFEIIIDDEKRESVLHSKLEKHIIHAMNSHLLLQFTTVLLGGIFVICGQLNEIPDDNEVEIVVVACVSLQLSHLLRNALVEEFYEHEKLWSLKDLNYLSIGDRFCNNF
ncbi:hypothetical protein V6N12_069645 [Hibiscus sabdariffa]|uniref:Uncharacterized protein n=1 Tax=Hibiscus sabdariffa TaxID=183260 RepID=A0ABR2FEF4_9ROSI